MSMTTRGAETPEAKLRNQLSALAPQFAMALPNHIKPERLQRVVMTVVQQNPDLMNADRRSLLGACFKCAADGLIPDGREAALVLFGGKVQYMPMMAGLLKRARNTGEIASVSAHVVFAADEFTIEYGDEERLVHKPKIDGERGEVRGAYAIARLKDGSIVREWMTKAEIEKVRNVSRAKNAGPWRDWYEEMCRKSALRRLSKWLPMDAETERAMGRDDSLGAPQGDADAATGLVIEGEAQEGGSSRMDALEGSLTDGPVYENASEAELMPHSREAE